MKTFYVGLKNQLVVLKETENGYDIFTHLECYKVNQLAVDPTDDNRLYVATDSGFWKSEDGGLSFIHSNNGLTSTNITAVAVSPLKQKNGNPILYVGTEPSMLFYSEDLGKSWQEFSGIQEMPSKSSWSFPPRPDTHYVRWITASENDPNYLAVSIEAGAVIYTTDHGKTWRDRAEVGPIDVHTLLKHPDEPSRLYAANGGMVTNRNRQSYAESYDGGYSWKFISNGLDKHPYLYNMALHPVDPDFRLVSASKNAKEAHNQPAYSTIYRKMGKEKWLEFADGLPKEGAFSHHLVNDPNQLGAFYAFNNFGIYHLGAEGDTWNKLDIPWTKDLGEMRPYFFTVT